MMIIIIMKNVLIKVTNCKKLLLEHCTVLAS